MLQIQASTQAYDGELVHGQEASIRVVPQDDEQAQLLHETLRQGCIAIAHYIDKRFGEEYFSKRINKHPFKKVKGKSQLQPLNWFPHTKNKAYRQQHGLGKHYTHEELIDSILYKCNNTLKSGGLEHFTLAQINRWNRYMRYMNLIEHRDYKGAWDTYKIQIVTAPQKRALKSKPGHICGMELAGL